MERILEQMPKRLKSHVPGVKRPEDAEWTQFEFLALVAHELRNSTHAIMSWAEHLCVQQASEETQVRAAEVIRRNCKMQANLINQLLDYSRLQNGTLKFDCMSLSLMPLLEAAIESAAHLAAAKSVELRASLDSGVFTVLGDPLRLQEVFANILSNAIKFTPSGGRVNVRSRFHKGYAMVTVKDTGRGISREFLPHVFDALRREKPGSEEPGGLGMGLAITRYIVEKHHGRIYAISLGERKGATFKVFIPLETRTFSRAWSILEKSCR